MKKKSMLILVIGCIIFLAACNSSGSSSGSDSTKVDTSTMSPSQTDSLHPATDSTTNKPDSTHAK